MTLFFALILLLNAKINNIQISILSFILVQLMRQVLSPSTSICRLFFRSNSFLFKCDQFLLFGGSFLPRCGSLFLLDEFFLLFYHTFSLLFPFGHLCFFICFRSFLWFPKIDPFLGICSNRNLLFRVLLFWRIFWFLGPRSSGLKDLEYTRCIFEIGCCNKKRREC